MSFWRTISPKGSVTDEISVEISFLYKPCVSDTRHHPSRYHALLFQSPAILDLIELKTYDLRFLSRGDVRAVAVCLTPLRRLHLLPAVLPAVVAPEHP